jgi:hypothetical protein
VRGRVLGEVGAEHGGGGAAALDGVIGDFGGFEQEFGGLEFERGEAGVEAVDGGEGGFARGWL